MLLSITVENFLSFKEETTISFKKKLRNSQHNHPNQVFSDTNTNTNTLKLITFFGTNGAGKSNIIRAIRYIDKAILTGKPDRTENFSFFNNDNPICLSIEFLTKDTIYQYSLKIVGRNLLCEKLSFKHNDKQDYQKIFERILSNEFYLYPDIDIQRFKPVALSSETRLSLHELATNRHLLEDEENEFLNHIRNVYKFFKKDLEIIFPNSHSSPLNLIRLIHSSEDDFKNAMTNFIGKFDIGIKNITIEKLDANKIIEEVFNGDSDEKKDFEQNKLGDKTKEDGLEGFNGILGTSKGFFYVSYNSSANDFSYSSPVTHHMINKTSEKALYFWEASSGTQRLINLFPIFDEKIKSKIILIDELENSLHPDIVVNLVETFTNNESLQDHQLILATHENALFHQDIIRKDGIFIIEKTALSQSYVQNLVDISNERFDKNLRRSYQLGLYGGVPRVI